MCLGASPPSGLPPTTHASRAIGGAERVRGLGRGRVHAGWGPALHRWERLPSGLRPSSPCRPGKEQPCSPAPHTEGLLSPREQAAHADFEPWLGQICVRVIIIF